MMRLELMRSFLLVWALLTSFTGYALEKTDPFLDLPEDLAPSLFRFIDTQELLDINDGSIRFVARVSGIERNAFLDQLSAEQRNTFNFVHVGKPYQPVHGGPTEAICECSLLLTSEFVISEMPLKLAEGAYVSINDESYKAILELIRYPFDDVELASVALSELAYVYNATALRLFLENKGFELLLDAGFMNSEDYPGYRDSQYLVTRGIDKLFIVIRGTSGALDIETTVDAEMVPFKDLGMVHKGYQDIAQKIFDHVTPLIRMSDEPLVVTGHSLGGSVSLMLTLMLFTEGITAENLNFAPVPMVDYRVASVFENITGITNYFLPNEELGSLEERGEWLYLPGARELLPEVGTTAGAAHFVINYLKSMLLTRGLSKTAYEDDMPDCVVTKYACFNGEKMNFISACAFESDSCMTRELELLFGYPLTSGREPDKETLIKSLTQEILTASTEHQQRILVSRLVYQLARTGRAHEAEALLSQLDMNSEAGFFHYLRDTVAGELNQETAP